jgi:hypothetical protein
VPIASRLAAADMAAVLGVFSSASLVDAHSLAMEVRDGEAAEGDAGQASASDVTTRLQTAFAGGDMDARLGALRQLWDEDDPLRRYARLVLTAGAVGQIQPAEDHVGDADEIVASLFAAGMDGEAAAWAGIVEDQGNSGLAWALLAVGTPRPVVGVDEGRIGGFGTGANGELKSRMLAAALAGLGRAGDGAASGLGVDIGRQDDWTRALDRAASANQPGTVALLAAIGMQSADWSGVPPEHLYRIVRALRQVGLEYEARMIAAEAITRL